MTTAACGINKMREFERVRCGDLGPGEGATREATMCPEINRYEDFRPVPTRISDEWRANRKWVMGRS
jgi:hypothetical protein